MKTRIFFIFILILVFGAFDFGSNSVSLAQDNVEINFDPETKKRKRPDNSWI